MTLERYGEKGEVVPWCQLAKDQRNLYILGINVTFDGLIGIQGCSHLTKH